MLHDKFDFKEVFYPGPISYKKTLSVWPSVQEAAAGANIIRGHGTYIRW